MAETLTGYQYNEKLAFIGRYVFPRNLDSDTVHLPPNTTIIPIPDTELIPGEEYYWLGDEWGVRLKEALAEIDHGSEASIDPTVPEPEPLPVPLPPGEV